MTPAPPPPRLSEPAPLALANTVWIDRTGVHDAIADETYANAWVRAVGEQSELTPASHDAEEVAGDAVERLVRLRDAVRRLAAEHTTDPRTVGQSPVPDVSTAMSIVNAAATATSVWPELRPDDRGVTRRQLWAGKSYADALITLIARQTIDFVTSPQWRQLRPCTAPGCAYYFVKDHFRREWCSALCGNRARVARHAQRQRG
ncbi:CGNR zinc finger domain-containing protein [Mycobacterium sp. NPDC048908]|uniref:CGNR zinc finger domain-containing protein n=1 Tax=Mycobacterium sp. NPDC048908 TaxID=3364292 RepID=UPI003714006E